MKQRQDYTFSQVPRVEIPRSQFNRSHQYKTTFDSGWLIPFLVEEALPGDTYRVKVSMFARLATPLVPIMDNIYLDVFFFAIPHRLVWSNWQRFCGEQTTPGASIDFLVPQVSTIPTVGSIFDYMGIPLSPAAIAFSALPLRCYNLLFNEWFRDQNLVVPTTVSLGDGPDAANLYALKRRGKRHDYFTSALPWPQKGVGVSISLTGTLPAIAAYGNATPTFRQIGGDGVLTPAVHALTAESAASVTTGEYITGGYKLASGTAIGTPGDADLKWLDSGLMVNLGAATAVTINALRESFQIQKMFEKDARGGTRYVELLKSHFGVTSPDARLQRSEYLGGGSVPVIINPVTQNTPTSGAPVTPMGSLAAYGTAGGSGIGFTKSFVEHCTIIGLVMARADLTYQQGLNRMWSRRTKVDFYWPSLSHLGEQAILNREIYARGDANDALVFGYQERWAEYRYYPSMVTALFRSEAPASIALWHLAQQFTSLPTLGPTFIEENPPIERTVAVQTAPEFLFDSFIEEQVARPMPVYSVPGLIDHF